MTNIPRERRPAPAPTIAQGSARSQPAPTVLQPGADRVVAPTVLQPASPGVPQYGGASVEGRRPAAGAQPEFPEQLLQRFRPVRLLGTGTEAAVWEVRRLDGDARRAVKVYWAGQRMDTGHLELLRQERFRRHVPEIFEFGDLFTADGRRGWVELELLSRSLFDLIESSRHTGGVPLALAEELVGELAATLRFWQDEVELNPIDVKPDNFMFRTERPARLVLTDFGGAAAFTASQLVGPAMAARAYMPPEELWEQRNRQWPWWGLGVIALELASGQTWFRAADGSLRDDKRVLRRFQAIGDPDLMALPDERWRLLISGLLTKVPEDRWGFEQVESWLAGDSPPVVRRGATGADRGPSNKPITFDGVTFHDPGELAAAMLDRWQQAASWLAGDGQQRLRDWLEEDLKDLRFDRMQYLRRLDGNPELAHATVSAFGAVMCPQAVPRYRGRAIDAGSLVALLPGADGHALFRELVDRRILPIAARYDCRHPECLDGQGCAVLDRLARDVPEIVAGVEARVAAVGASTGDHRGLPRSGLSQAERDRIYGQAGALTIDPAAHRSVRARLGPARSPVAWWPGVRSAARAANGQSVAGRVAVVTAMVLDDRRQAVELELRAATRARQAVLSRAVRQRAAAAVLGIIAMVAAAGAGAWVRAVKDVPVDLSWAYIAAFGGEINEVAAAWQHRLLLPLSIVAIGIAALSGRRPRPIMTATACAAVLGYLAVQLPGFGITGPGWLGDALSWAASLLTGKATVVMPVAWGIVAIGLASRAVTFLERSSPAWPAADLTRLPRPRTRLRRLCYAPLPLVALLGALWLVVVVRLTITDAALGGAGIGEIAGYHQSRYLLALAVVAVTACLLQPPAGRSLLTLALVAVVARALWPQPATWLEPIERPTAEGPLLAIGGGWGAWAFWAALLICLPITIGSVSATRAVLRSY